MAIESTAGFVRMTREVLAASGFVRREKNGIVWWESAPRDDLAGRNAGVSPAEHAASRRLAAEARSSHLRRSPPGSEDAPCSAGEDAGVPDVSKPTVVLVHGANDQAGTWFTVAAALARTHHVIAPDLAGHGESVPFEGPIPIPLLVEGLHTAIGEASDITLVGNSLGGWLAMLYTLEHPDRVKRLVLEDAGGLSIPLATDIVAHDRAEALIILRAVHGPNYVPQEWVIETLLARAIDSPMLRITEGENHILDARLREIEVPTTLIWGADDGVLPLSYAEVLRDGIRGATLQVVEGAAHIPHLQQPERTLSCLTATF